MNLVKIRPLFEQKPFIVNISVVKSNIYSIYPFPTYLYTSIVKFSFNARIANEPLKTYCSVYLV